MPISSKEALETLCVSDVQGSPAQALKKDLDVILALLGWRITMMNQEWYAYPGDKPRTYIELKIVPEDD